MAAAKKTNENLSQTGQNLIRILIASYFIAVSVGMISGTDATPLAATFLPPVQAQFVGSATIFILGYMVMTGIWLRPAALILGLIMFWSSYIANFGASSTAVIGDFWRDLTLVGALMLTYVKSAPRATQRRAMIRWTPRVRRIQTKTMVAPRRVVSKAKPSNVVRLRSAPRAPVATKTTENIFRDALEDAAAS